MNHQLGSVNRKLIRLRESSEKNTRQYIVAAQMAKKSTPHLESAEVLDKELQYVMKTLDEMNRSQGQQHSEIEALASTAQELQRSYRDLRGALEVQLIETRYHGIEVEDLLRDIELRRQPTTSAAVSPPKKQKSGDKGAKSGAMSGATSGTMPREESTQRGRKFPRVRKFRGKNEEEVTSDDDEEDEEETEIYRDLTR